MNFINFFKKVQIFALLVVTVSALNAMDDLHDRKDHEEMQEESKDTGHIFIQKLSSAVSKFSLQNSIDFVKEVGVDAASLVNAGFEKAGDQIQKIQNSDFYKQAGKSLKDGYESVKGSVNKAVNKVQNIDFSGTKKTVNDTLDSTKSLAQGSVQSIKSWFNQRTEYSSDELAIFGGAALAVVTIAGVTYVLYKNGTIKKCGNVICKYPVLTTLSAATAGLLLTAVYLLSTHQTEPVVAETK